jgi:ketosteroid isomerase-like protein
LFAECINRGDLAGVAELYEERAVLIGADDKGATGHAAIRAALAGMVEAGAQIAMNVVRSFESDGVAVLYNDWRATIGEGAGATVIEGKAVEVCHRQADGTWLFAVDAPYARSGAQA